MDVPRKPQGSGPIPSVLEDFHHPNLLIRIEGWQWKTENPSWMKMYFLLKPHSIHGTGIFSYIYQKNHPHVVRKCHTWILLKHGYFPMSWAYSGYQTWRSHFFLPSKRPATSTSLRCCRALRGSGEKNICCFFFRKKINRTFRSESLRYFCFFVGCCRFCIYFWPVFAKKRRFT